MLCEKPEEKETKATGYTIQERYRSRWLSPISRYSHLCAGDGQESGSHPQPLWPSGALLLTRKWRLEEGRPRPPSEWQVPKRRQEQDPGSLSSSATP